jgi:hypothetical protein
LIVPSAAHSPHLSDPDLVVGATARFVEVST